MILNVYKEKNMTSRDVVNILSKHFQTKKIGHTGTLDPIATGVLLVCTGHDTKLVDCITASKKEYIATMKLGIKTDTADITGNIIEKKEYHFTEEKLKQTLSSFIGEINQTVPMYSAVKINGKKLYEYARQNIPITPPTRKITIYNIELLEYHEDIIKFKTTVSKGTYIRTLIEDIATKLNTLATMTDLIRTKQGDFSIEKSNKIEDILKDKYNTISILELFKSYKQIPLDSITYKQVKNGRKIPFKETEEFLLLTYNNEPIALYQKEDTIYRVFKMFQI